MRKTITILIPIIICFLVGFLSSNFQHSAIEEWYPSLNKSSLTPPNFVFPIAWGIIYLCTGISMGFIILNLKQRNVLLALFCVQLLLSSIWNILFFYLQNPLLGLIDIIMLDICVILYMYNSYQKKYILSFVLFIPYLNWLCYATYLNGYILYYN